ncbi:MULTISPECIES: LrgB family protein [Exiguobacterium]|uniref:LrgB family protein n=1 Tax=Exiguobacterium alkaliphilum TaxID=1428684 RepID=A0ABT2KTR6_9BACL|nr:MULTISPECIES: LrgB family protein [Exiguobacterium]MCT4794367.1 LrgB family protein [Exiguobacterium alkaliphilum]
MTLVWIAITIGVYVISRKLSFKWASPFTNVVFLSTTILIVTLLLSGQSYDVYEPAKDVITILLGPATVALGLPLYRNLPTLLARARRALGAIVIGTLSTIVVAVLLGSVLKLTDHVLIALSVKSVTSPIALELARQLQGDAALAASVAVACGILGAMLGPFVLNTFGVTDPFTRGLALGTISHGIGTAQAATEHPLSGATGGAAMGLAAIFTSFLLPYLLPFLI